jgi:hypothetical protein
MMRERKFPFDRNPKPTFATSDGARNQKTLSVFPDVGEERFKLPTYAGEVGIGGFRVDMAGDVYGIKAECIRGRVDGKVVHVTKGEVGVECGGVGPEGGCVKRET